MEGFNINLEIKAIENYVKHQETVIKELSEIVHKQQATIKRLKIENNVLKRRIGEQC